ncbi:hypothetical protein GCM10009555_080780 [Acrocarpospora macrocephala]|uniref:Uncharacterized protein n=1 Tax=Acrocarpospora macrocephala TaxID=150177 RepID=A0A5M3WMN7_9ACTN|nr:hypothetical protein [Acrocarpospora macrocephala]GES10144.1 hypothetical protein Amac_037410 [Acrocarpospora macrocephala]
MAAEFQLGDYILVQDGRTLEIFHRGLSESSRYHVVFLGVDVQPHGDGFKVRLGVRRGDDQVIGGVRLKMNQEEFARFRDFIALAIAARDGASSLDESTPL